MPTGLLFLIVLLVVVVIHEAGHFFAAKQMGMRVKEFAFGFPPRLFGIKRGETTYAINAIPLGGYVSIDGENSIEGENDPKLFTSKSKLAQAWVIFAGPLMNIVLAIVLMSISFMVGYGGQNTNDRLVILSIAPNSPAEVAGIRAGDTIYSIYNTGGIDPTIDPDVEMFRQGIDDSKGGEIIIEVLRGKETVSLNVTPEFANEEYKIGVSLGKLESKKLGFFPAIAHGTTTALQMTRDTVVGFVRIIGSLFTGGDMGANLTGPIGIAKEVGTASKFGFAYLLSFVALISVNLGVLNMFPFPALDGGRLLFLGIEKVKGSRIKPSVANAINLIGFGLLLLLMVGITIKDVIKLF